MLNISKGPCIVSVSNPHGPETLNCTRGSNIILKAQVMNPYIVKFARLSVEVTCINRTVSFGGQVTTPVSQKHEPNEPRVDS